MRIGDDLLDDSVTLSRLDACDPHAESVSAEVFDRGLQIAPLVMKEGLTVADQELKVANLRMVDRRIVDFVEYAVRDRVPDAARTGVGGADHVLGATGPSGLDARTAESLG